MSTIQIDGQEFSVTVNEGKDRFGRYTLRKIGGRGLTYTTMRNAHRPHMMCLLNPNASGARGVTNLWLSDEGGTLRQVHVL